VRFQTSFFILPAQVIFKLAECRIDRDAGRKNVNLSFDRNRAECTVAMIVDVIDGCGEDFVFQIVQGLGRSFGVRAPTTSSCVR